MSPTATVDSSYPSNPSSTTMSSLLSDFNFQANNASSSSHGSECSFNSGSSFPPMARNGSRPAARPKARLLKKRVNSRHLRSSSSTVDSYFNPFRLSSDPLKDNGEGIKVGENICFVSGVYNSKLSNTGNIENGDNVGCVSREKTEGGEEGLNSHNVGHVSGCSTTYSSSKSGEQSEAVEKLVSDDKLSCNGVGSVASTNYSNSVLNSSSEDGGRLGKDAENLVSAENQREKLGNTRDNEKLDYAEILFGSCRVVPEFSHGVEKREDGLHTRTTSSESGVKVKLDSGVEFGKVDDLSYVLSAGRTNWPPNSGKDKDVIEESVDKQPPHDRNRGSISSGGQIGENINIGVESEVCKREGVVFRDYEIHSAENITSEKKDFIDKLGKSVPDDMQKTGFDVEAGHERKKANHVSFSLDNHTGTFNLNECWEQGASLFGSGSETGSYQERTAAKISEKMKGENIGGDGGIFKDQGANVYLNEAYLEVKLLKELNKLKIDNPEKISHAGMAYPLSTRACTNDNVVFTFRSSKLDSSSPSKGPEVSPGKPSTSCSEGSKDNDVGSAPGKSTHSSEGGQSGEVLDSERIKLGGDAVPSSSLPRGFCAQPNNATCSTCVDETQVEFGFASSSNQFSVNLSHGLNRKLDRGARTRLVKSHKMKKTWGNLRQPNPAKKQLVQESLSSRSAPQVNVDGFECCSPMDFSPYEESAEIDVAAEETTMTPEEPAFIEKNHTPFGAHYSTVSTDHNDEKLSAAYSQSKPFCINLGVGVTTDTTGAGVTSNTSKQENEGANTASNLSDGRENFAFNAPASVQSHIPSIRRPGKKKYRMKIGHVSGASSIIQETPLNDTACTNRVHGESKNLSSSESKEKGKSIAEEEQGPLSAWTTAEEACEKWRLRGNQAYKDGELSKAEDFYTWGINCLPSCEVTGFSVKPLVLCHSNRAATRMAVGKLRQALQDCLSAARLDPDFLKARIRAGNCHLLLGELEDAIQYFDKCLESENVVCLDRRVVIAASDGLQKAQKVMEFTTRSTELLKLRTSEHAATALELIAEAMSISPYSEKLLEMKAEALCTLRKYEEVIQLCQQSLDFAEKNFTLDASEWKNKLNVRLWRQHMLSKCYFCLGRLDCALDILEKGECRDKTGESSHPLAVTIHELLKHKRAGNEAFQSGNHVEAIEHYTSAICSSIESRPFVAICFCNRAAAHQALGQIADAISDCSLAIALDENYAKAVSRRATLHELIRDYEQAAADLRRLVSLLEKQSHLKGKQSGSGNEKELRQAYKRLSLMELEAKKGIPMDLYLILGIKQSDPAAEIKKAYRKAALRHHPDKAAQALVRNESGDDGQLWKDIADLVHKDSDRLFKMIGEAYAVLSDPEKRSEYDHKEDMRKATKASCNVRSTLSRQSDAHVYSHYPYGRSSSRRYGRESYYRTYSDRSYDDPSARW